MAMSKKEAADFFWEYGSIGKHVYSQMVAGRHIPTSVIPTACARAQSLGRSAEEIEEARKAIVGE